MLSFLLLADEGVVHGHNTLADILFLIACILAFIAAVFHWRPVTNPPGPSIAAALLCVAVALIALGWFVL